MMWTGESAQEKVNLNGEFEITKPSIAVLMEAVEATKAELERVEQQVF